jgi:hypothetical protein
VPECRRTVIEVDHVSVVGTRTRPRTYRADASAHVHARFAQARGDGVGVAGMIAGQQPWPGLNDGRGYTETRVNLCQLATGWSAAQHEQAARQLAGECRLAVGPDMDIAQAVDRRDLRRRANGDDDIARVDDLARAVRTHFHAAAAHDSRGPAKHDGAGVDECRHVARVVRFRITGSAVDHVVAPFGRALPRVIVATIAPRGRVEQRF